MRVYTVVDLTGHIKNKRRQLSILLLWYSKAAISNPGPFIDSNSINQSGGDIKRTGKHLKDPLSTGMLWVDQQYQNTILDCQKQTNSLKLMTEEPPVQTNTKSLL